jgi:arylsulfatase A-like enzyme
MPLSRRSFLAATSGLAASAVSAQANRRPNVLFCIADDWGWPHAGAYGAGWINTPSFDRIAREGVLFNNCFTSNPKCSPCRATILTGRNTWQLEEAIDHFGIFPHKWKVYPEILEDNGYWVGMTGKGWGPGDYVSGGFDRNPAGPEFQERRVPVPASGISGRDYAGNFEDFLAKRPEGKPFCFWLGGNEPHRAYEDGSGLRAGLDPKKVDVPKYYPDNAVVRGDMLDYAVEVEWFDSHVGKAMDKLAEMGELDNTIVVMSSDHGMPFPRVKGQIYESGFHIPLAIRWGGMQGGRTVDDFINVRDFAPTYLEMAGVPKPDSMTGKSFLGVLRSNKSGWIDESRNVMLVGKERHDLGRPHDAGYPVRAIRTKDFLYVRNFQPDAWPAGNPETGYRNVDDSPTKRLLLRGFDKFYRMSFGKRMPEELYRIGTDPDCMENVANDPEFWKVKSELRARMEEMLRAEGDPRALGDEEVFETYRYVGGRGHSYDAWLENQKP